MATDSDFALAQALVDAFLQRGLKITTAESCTGGLLSGAITEIPGSSGMFDQGIISYADSVKMRLLGVKEATLEKHGAVSEETAREMAEGARKNAKADMAVSITGIAGPGTSPGKPVGLVYIGVNVAGSTIVECFNFSGGRQEIRVQTVRAALELALKNIPK